LYTGTTFFPDALFRSGVNFQNNMDNESGIMQKAFLLPGNIKGIEKEIGFINLQIALEIVKRK
jgi:hypothetical protein